MIDVGGVSYHPSLGSLLRKQAEQAEQATEEQASNVAVLCGVGLSS